MKALVLQRLAQLNPAAFPTPTSRLPRWLTPAGLLLLGVLTVVLLLDAARLYLSGQFLAHAVLSHGIDQHHEQACAAGREGLVVTLDARYPGWQRLVGSPLPGQLLVVCGDLGGAERQFRPGQGDSTVQITGSLPVRASLVAGGLHNERITLMRRVTLTRAADSDALVSSLLESLPAIHAPEPRD